MKILFKETQRINLFWKGLLGTLIVILLVVNIYAMLTNKQEIGLNSFLILPAVLLFIIICAALATMKTEIDEHRISITFFPVLVKKKTFLWEDVESSFIREYNPIQEFGGWSVFRINSSTVKGLGNNRALNVKGNKGLQLILKDGSKWLIGTNKSEELDKVLKIVS